MATMSLVMSRRLARKAGGSDITKLANQTMVLVVKDKQKFSNAAALLAAAKAKPGQGAMFRFSLAPAPQVMQFYRPGSA